MKSILLTEYGPPESALQIADQPVPVPKEDELLVRVMATSMNPIDCRMRAGYGKAILTLMTPLPIVLGRDFSGVVVDAGAKIRHFNIGDAVYGAVSPFCTTGLQHGAHSEYICVPASDCAKKPAAYTFVEAASLPYVALTTWNALITQNGLPPAAYAGKKILVLAGAGGVGTFAIQFLKQLDAAVAATCSIEKAAFVRSLGADRVIDYKTENYAALLQDYDLVYDLLGKEHTDTALSVLTSTPCSPSIQAEIHRLAEQSALEVKNAGEDFGVAPYKNILQKFDQAISALITPLSSYVSIVGPMMPLTDSMGFHPGMRAYVLETLHKKAVQLSLHRRRFNYAFFTPNPEGFNCITEMITKGNILPHISRTFSFEAAVEAHKAMDTGRTQGKIVLIP
jgi:NADPH:quinone reductase-like Zn-dependent oxidoreductase